MSSSLLSLRYEIRQQIYTLLLPLPLHLCACSKNTTKLTLSVTLGRALDHVSPETFKILVSKHLPGSSPDPADYRTTTPLITLSKNLTSLLRTCYQINTETTAYVASINPLFTACDFFCLSGYFGRLYVEHCSRSPMRPTLLTQVTLLNAMPWQPGGLDYYIRALEVTLTILGAKCNSEVLTDGNEVSTHAETMSIEWTVFKYPKVLDISWTAFEKARSCWAFEEEREMGKWYADLARRRRAEREEKTVRGKLKKWMGSTAKKPVIVDCRSPETLGDVVKTRLRGLPSAYFKIGGR